MSQNYNIITKGADISLSVYLQTKNLAGVVLPENLTGKTISMVYKDATNTVITKISPQVTVIDAVYGSVSLSLTDTDTEALKLGEFAFDIIVDDGSDRKIWKISKQVTVQDRVR